MDIRQFQAVDAIVREKSITRAAEKINISQQALSTMIKKLESECGISIFKRTAKGTQLTEEGEQFYRCIVPVLTEYQIAVNKIAQIEASSPDMVRFGAAIGAFHTLNYNTSTALLARFQEEYPDASFTSYEYPDRTIEEMLLRDELDCALTLKPRMSGIMHNKIVDIPMAVYMCSTNRLSERESISFADLRDERFVMVPKDMQFRDLTEERCRNAGFRPQIVFVASDIISILDRVKAQNAVFVGMDRIHDVEGLTKVALDEPDFYWSLCMAYTKTTLLDKKKAKVLRCMSDFFRKMK